MSGSFGFMIISLKCFMRRALRLSSSCQRATTSEDMPGKSGVIVNISSFMEVLQLPCYCVLTPRVNRFGGSLKESATQKRGRDHNHGSPWARYDSTQLRRHDVSSQPFFVPAVIILVASIPLVLGLVPRNRAYGIRTRKTLADERTWHSVNRYGGWTLLGASLFYLVVAWLFPCSSRAGAGLFPLSLHLAAFVGPRLLGVLLIRQYARHP